MSMEFEKNVPEWNATGTEPPDSLKTSGFVAGYKPPAQYFNWFWNKTYLCLKELQEKVKDVAGTYLPLSGGKMTGNIEFSNANAYLKKTNTSGSVNLCSGTSYDDSAAISLYGTGYTTDATIAGGFAIRTGQNDQVFRGYTNGQLTWSGKHVLRDSFSMPSDDGSIALNSGSETFANGAHLRMYGKSHTEYPGMFSIGAANGTDAPSLDGSPDGTLKWNGKSVTLAGDCLSLAGGTMDGAINFKNNTEQKIYVDSNGDLLLGDNDVGGLLRVRGNNSDSNQGGFQFRAQDSNNSVYLIGKPDGTLTWNGKSLVDSAYKLPYATCSTASTTAAKVATITNSVSFSLVAGATVNVKFSNGLLSSGIYNNFDISTLNVNSTGAKTVKLRYVKGVQDIPPHHNNNTYQFVYDGTYWNEVSGLVQMYNTAAGN